MDERLTFDRARYEAAFTDANERVAAFPHDESAHHGRRFSGPGSGDGSSRVTESDPRAAWLGPL